MGYIPQLRENVPHLALSDFKISKAKPKDKPYKLYDSLGLFLLVSPNGSKLWRQKYKYMGKEGLLTHGAYPTVSLAVVTMRAENDPTFALKDALFPPKMVSRAAITDEAKFGQLLRDLDAYTGWRITVEALKFQILTMTRPGEVRGAKKQEFDLEKRIWTIPVERTKMRREHLVPLSDQALQIVKGNWPEIEGVALIFPSLISNRKWISENAFNSALRRMGYTKEEVTAHGFRATASTILNTRGFDPEVIEAALAHQDKNAIRRTYNRSTYWEQRIILMQDWADLVDDFRLCRQ